MKRIFLTTIVAILTTGGSLNAQPNPIGRACDGKPNNGLSYLRQQPVPESQKKKEGSGQKGRGTVPNTATTPKPNPQPAPKPKGSHS